ncbi:MAG: FG-GAP repeat protein [Planctomycetota bacterium]|jgi:hypothetical protein
MEKPQRSKIHMAVATVFCLAATAFAAELPVRVMTIDKQPPERPYAKLVADFNSDGLPDIAIGGANGPLVWYAYPTWTKRPLGRRGSLQKAVTKPLKENLLTSTATATRT